MIVGEALLSLAQRTACSDLAIVGTAKNAGKTVTARAIMQAAQLRGAAIGVTSIGRDGEAVDSTDAVRKPRLGLRRGAIVATALGALTASPAFELLDVTSRLTAAGKLAVVRLRTDAFVELVGPPTASGVRYALDRMRDYGATITILDGALDRVAALAGGREAIVVAVGASGVRTFGEALDEIAALVAKLSLRTCDPDKTAIRVDGALTAARATQLIAEYGESPLIVRDPTRLALTGKALLGLLDQIDVRVEQPLRVIAVSIASIGRDHSFAPREFLHGVARVTKLPTFDVYAGAAA